MVTGSETNGLPFHPFHRPRYNSGGSAWLLSGAILACGVALPGICLAWQWKKTKVADPLPLMVSMIVVDTVFILTATVFLSTGGLLGRQRYGISSKYPGPFKEQDGSYFPPAYVQPYVMTAALLFGVVTPTIVLGNLLWRHEIILGVCTLGVYLLEVAAQLISETVYVRKDGPDWLWALQAGLLVLWVFNCGVVMSWTPWLYRWHLQPDSSPKPLAKAE